MVEGRRMYNLKASDNNGRLVRSMTSEDFEDDDYLLPNGQLKSSSGGCNYLRAVVIALSVAAIFTSGYFFHVLISGFGTPVAEHKIENIAHVIEPDKIREVHIELSKQTHLAGSQRNYELAQLISKKFHEYAFDSVEMKNYSIRLPYPDPNKPNSVTLLDSSGTEIHSCLAKEPPLTDFEIKNPTTPIFNAHSKAGTVKAPYVYVNNADKGDFEFLRMNNITVKGKIVIARLGVIYRGNKVRNAARAGALGIVLFKDLLFPEQESRYPDSEFAPGSAAERGNVLVDDGDQDTLGWPSVQQSFLKRDGDLVTAAIISQPITGDDAAVLLKALPRVTGVPVPKNWLPSMMRGVEFGLGDGNEDGPQLEVTVSTEIRRVNITNVIGTITGDVEPDRWIILGNHRDAWTYGAMDPSSGTAVLVEVARALAHFLNKGWRPRRTLKICSWDAEEWGLIGSLEWVEEYRALLRARAVAYLNVDIAEGGKCEAVGASGNPMYFGAVGEILEGINEKLAPMSLSGSGSDQFGFLSYAGVSVLEMRCADYEDLYHTGYDTQRLFQLVDKDYKTMAKVTTALAKMAVKLTETPLLPGNIQDYTGRIQSWWEGLRPEIAARLREFGEDEGLLGLMDGVVDKLVASGRTFQTQVYGKLTEKSGQLETRRVNNIIMEFERAFLTDRHLPGTDFYARNILLSPSADDLYAGAGFPSLRYAVSGKASRDELLMELESVRWALSSATYVITMD